MEAGFEPGQSDSRAFEQLHTSLLSVLYTISQSSVYLTTGPGSVLVMQPLIPAQILA